MGTQWERAFIDKDSQCMHCSAMHLLFTVTEARTLLFGNKHPLLKNAI